MAGAMSVSAPGLESVPAYTTRVLPAPAAGVAQDSTVPRSFRYSSRAAVPGTFGMSADPPGTPGTPHPTAGQFPPQADAGASR